MIQDNKFQHPLTCDNHFDKCYIHFNIVFVLILYNISFKKKIKTKNCEYKNYIKLNITFVKMIVTSSTSCSTFKCFYINHMYLIDITEILFQIRLLLYIVISNCYYNHMLTTS